MIKKIELVDKGRGLQLSTSRITVMDLVHYFRNGCSYEEIIRWLPTLSTEEIVVVEAYYREHKDELDEKDQQVMAYREEQTRLQRIRFPMPEETTEERRTRLRKLLEARLAVKNGEGHPR